MSQENVEVVRRCYEHLSRSREMLREALDPQVEFDFAWMDGRGPDAWNEAVSEWVGTFEEWRIEARKLTDLPHDRVLVIARDWGRPKGSDAEIDNEFAHLWWLRDGLVTRFQAFTTEAEALEAAGLSE